MTVSKNKEMFGNNLKNHWDYVVLCFSAGNLTFMRCVPLSQ
jgi:hypothetical protein